VFPDNIQPIRCLIAIIIPFLIAQESADMDFNFRNRQLLHLTKNIAGEKKEKR
jgi:hypothetical protein